MVSPTAPRVGVVVPSGNAAVEPELAALLAGRANVYASRFPVYAEYDQRVRIAKYNAALPAAIEAFGSLKPAAIVAECSGSHYLQGPERDRRFFGELSERFGTRVTSVTQTVLDAFEQLGITEITLVSPYAPWLTELSRNYWEEAGLKVRDIVKVRSAKGFSPYDVKPDELVTQIIEAGRPADEVLLCTGTGMFTLDALARLGAGTERTILTSNLCTAWWAMRTVSPDSGTETYVDWPLDVTGARA